MIERIKSNKIIASDALLSGYVYFEDGKITAVTADELPFDTEYDKSGLYVAPGFIDMHTHGGAGHEFFSTAADMVAACNFHLSHGTTSICPTISAYYRNSNKKGAPLKSARNRDQKVCI